MRNILEDLYYGNICPSDQIVMERSDYAEAFKTVVGGEGYLDEVLHETEKKALKKLVEAYGQLLTITSREMFIQGFRLGVRMGIEVMDDDADGIKDLVQSIK